MNKNELEKELSKEILKKIIDNNNNPVKTKEDMKTIVDISDTSEEIFERTLAYFAILNMAENEVK